MRMLALLLMISMPLHARIKVPDNIQDAAKSACNESTTKEMESNCIAIIKQIYRIGYIKGLQDSEGKK